MSMVRERDALPAARPEWMPNYIPELQGLRGIAVLMVVVYHCHALLEGTWLHYASLWGWAGVNLFFVLSGFLITSILIEARGKPHYFRNFYARRALRIWPVYVLLLAICYAVLDWFLGDTWAHQTRWQTLVAYALFLQNLRHTALPGTLGPTWSLAIEEQYYFVWAPVVWASGVVAGGRWLSRALHALLPLALTAMLVCSPLVRRMHPHWITTTHTAGHLDGIALGSLLALGLYHLKLDRRLWLGLGLAAMVAGWVLAATWAGGTAYLDSALALMFAGVVTAAIAGTGARNPVAWVLRKGPLPYYGKISYGLYMMHILVFVYWGSFDARLDHMGVPGHLTILALRLVAATVAATVLWYGFESRILRLKKYF